MDFWLFSVGNVYEDEVSCGMCASVFIDLGCVVFFSYALHLEIAGLFV